MWLEALVKLFWNNEHISDCIQVEIKQKQAQTKCSKDEACRSSRTVHAENKRLRRKSQRNNGLFSLKASGGTKMAGRLLIKIKGHLGIRRKVLCL